ncbi:MAG TPA: oxidoreductase [Spirochaetaceae bacterium]|jgi:predicted dehydrogenase|nr:oxidoreductase [Spirochaetaceae bacterium]
MIGVAIIGTGDIADFHIEAYLRFPERCAIRAVVDLEQAKARQKADKFGLSCEALADYRELLTRNDIGLVSICLPPALHAPVSVDFLAAAKHVLCEKPMAPTLEECDRMLEAARRGKATLSVIAQNRFKPDIMRTKRFLESGALGRILFAQANSLWWRGEKYYDLWWRGTWEKEGGGCTFIHAVHHIDLLLWFMGDVEEVTATLYNRSHDNSEVEDLSISSIRFKSGAPASLVSSLVHHGEEQSFIIDGEAASIELPHKIAVSRQLDNGYPEADEEKRLKLEALYTSLPEPQYTDHCGQIEDVLSAIESGQTPLVDGQAGRSTVDFIMAAYQSAFTGKPVRLPLSPKDPFYSKEGIRANAKKFHQKTTSLTSLPSGGISVGGSL